MFRDLIVTLEAVLGDLLTAPAYLKHRNTCQRKFEGLTNAILASSIVTGGHGQRFRKSNVGFPTKHRAILLPVFSRLVWDHPEGVAAHLGKNQALKRIYFYNL